MMGVLTVPSWKTSTWFLPASGATGCAQRRKQIGRRGVLSGVSWLPVELELVAMRLGRADELTYQLLQIALAWSHNDGQGAVAVKERRSATPGMVEAVLASVRPIPPRGAMLFSEVINHLRSALDNVVFHLVTQARHPSTARARVLRRGVGGCGSSSSERRTRSPRPPNRGRSVAPLGE